MNIVSLIGGIDGGHTRERVRRTSIAVAVLIAASALLLLAVAAGLGTLFLALREPLGATASAAVVASSTLLLAAIGLATGRRLLRAPQPAPPAPETAPLAAGSHRRGADSLESLIRANPGTAAASALVVGLAAGAVMTPRRAMLLWSALRLL